MDTMDVVVGMRRRRDDSPALFILAGKTAFRKGPARVGQTTRLIVCLAVFHGGKPAARSGKRFWPFPPIEGWMLPLRPEGAEGVAERGADGRPGAPAPRELHGRNLSEVGDAGGHPRGSSVPSQPRALGRNPFGIGDGVISKSHRGAIRKHRFAGEGEHGVAPFGLGGLGGIHQQVERGSQGASRQQAACRKRHQVAAVQGGCAAGWSGSSGSMR